MNIALIIFFCLLYIVLIEAHSNLSEEFDVDLIRLKRLSGRHKKDEFGYDFVKHNNFTEIEKYLKSVAGKYKKDVLLKVPFKTHEKRNIYAVHISRNINSSTKKPVIIFECGMHAREWTSIEACIYTIKMLVYGGNGRKFQSKLMEKYLFIFFPVVNPDGYVYSMTKDKYWRKNRSPGEKCNGVDINRNFGVKFCMDKNQQSNSCSPTYCGKIPFSERESQAIKKVIQKNKNNLLAYIAVHTYGNLWMTPFSYSKKQPKLYSELARVAFIGMQGVKRVRNTTMSVGPISLIIYASGGTGIDYAYLIGKAKYAYALEIGENYSIDSRKELFLTIREIYKGLTSAMMAMKP